MGNVGNIDLDALAREAGAASGEGPAVTWKGQSFRTVPDFPLLEMAEALDILEMALSDAGLESTDNHTKAQAAMRVVQAAYGIFGLVFVDAAELERFKAMRPGVQVLLALAKAIPGAYGLGDGLGEPSESSPSSPETSPRSTSTSDASTGSTSEPTSPGEPAIGDSESVASPV